MGLQNADSIKKPQASYDSVMCWVWWKELGEEETTVMALCASCAPEHRQAPGWEQQVTSPLAVPEAVLGNIPLGKKEWQGMGVNIPCVKALTGDGFRKKYISFINPYFSFLNK